MFSRSRAPVVVVAGLPGAGKSTLIDRAVDPAAWVVRDTDRLRARARGILRRRPLLYAWHYLGIVDAILGRRPVVVHSRGTRGGLRRAIAALSRAVGRPPVLVLLDASPEAARAGQHARGRVVSEAEMDGEAERWLALLAAAEAGRLTREGWRRVVVLDRAQAARLHAAGPAAFTRLVAPPARSMPVPRPILGAGSR